MNKLKEPLAFERQNDRDTIALPRTGLHRLM